MPRGGARKGTPGKSYTNRTDLSLGNVASGQTYGKRAEQQAAQRSMPVGPPPQSPTPAPPAPMAPGSAGMAPPAAPTGPLPGELTPLTAESERPDEPLTAGMSMGAGPGPEALGGLSGVDEPEDDYADLEPYMPMLEFMASQPGASAATRNFVRRVRGSRPVV